MKIAIGYIIIFLLLEGLAWKVYGSGAAVLLMFALGCGSFGTFAYVNSKIDKIHDKERNDSDLLG